MSALAGMEVTTASKTDRLWHAHVIQASVLHGVRAAKQEHERCQKGGERGIGNTAVPRQSRQAPHAQVNPTP